MTDLSVTSTAKDLNAIADVHCQICGRAIQAATGLVAHHGYTRPERYSGWQTASCRGARKLPYEVTAEAIPEEINLCLNWKNKVEARVAWLANKPQLTNPTYTDWFIKKASGKNKRRDGTEIEQPVMAFDYPGDWHREEALEMHTARYDYMRVWTALSYNTQRELEAVTAEVARLEVRLASWAPVTIEQQRAIAAALVIAKTAPPAPGTRAAVIAANKAKREAKEAAFVASIPLACKHGSNRLTCTVHGHASFLDDPKYANPMTMCDAKSRYLARTT